MKALVAALLLAASLPLAAAEPPKDKALHAFFQREFLNDLKEQPENGTELGLEGYDDRWTDHAPAAVARRRAHTLAAIRELERFDPKKLNTQDRVSREVMLFNLRLAAQEDRIYGKLPFGGGSGWVVASTMNGPQFTVPFVVKATRFRTARDYDNYLKRLEALPTVLQQAEDRLRAGLASGWVLPKQSIARVPSQLEPFAAGDIHATPLGTPFREFPAAVSEADRMRYAEAGRSLLETRVQPAYARFKAFYEREYLPDASGRLGAQYLPGGREYYALLAYAATTTKLSPEAIHEIGLKEVARIRAEMDKTIASTGFKGSFAEFLKFINTDPRFFFKTPEARLMAYRDIAKRADAALPPLFAQLPRTPYGVRAMEAYEGDNADHYSPPALDGSRAGFFEANVNNLQNRPSHEMESTLLHEAVPGHHLQGARSLELADLPEFRRSGFFVAYGEGWALYAESLGYEMGFYKDPYDRFGALSSEMLRACRLVVDTGLHTKDWTREQAIRYLVDNAGISEAFATAETDRYINLPGQALGYKIGELKIKALRAKAQAALGGRFDIRRFHNAILDDGALPLEVLERRIDEWIGREKRKAVKSPQ